MRITPLGACRSRRHTALAQDGSQCAAAKPEHLKATAKLMVQAVKLKVWS